MCTCTLSSLLFSLADLHLEFGVAARLHLLLHLHRILVLLVLLVPHAEDRAEAAFAEQLVDDVGGLARGDLRSLRAVEEGKRDRRP